MQVSGYYPERTSSGYLPDWVMAFDPEKRMITGKPYWYLKRVMDFSLIFLSFPVWSVLFLLTAAVIWVSSPGYPVIFRQCRTGRGGYRFMMYKFRTMVPGAEDLKSRYLDSNELQWPDFKLTDDPRVTRLGKFLRKTSLDEIPQIFNILKGNMTLVGPRPTSFSAEMYELWHTERLEITPGLTGLWQVLGRGETEFDERLRYDLAYLSRRSFVFDFVILWRTFGAVLQQKGAK